MRIIKSNKLILILIDGANSLKLIVNKNNITKITNKSIKCQNSR